MKKLLFVLIFILIAINFYLFFIDGKGKSSSQITIQLADSAETIEPEKSGLDEFQLIDLAFLQKGLDKKNMYSKRTDSLWFKYIKLPDSCSLSRYNLFFQKIMTDNGLTIDKASEFEMSKKMVYNFMVQDTIPAVVELRVTPGLESDLNINGSLCIIIYCMGNEWGKPWVRDILALPLPVVISILPNNPPAWARDTIIKEAAKNNKDILVSLPMEPEAGNIDKENPVKLVKGMNYLSIDIVFDKIFEVFNAPKGIINYKGSKVISDYQTMDQFFKKMSGTGLNYIEIEPGSDSYSALLCEEYKIPFISTREHFSEAKDLKENFDRISAEILSGNDILLVLNANEGMYSFLKDELTVNSRDINFLTIDQFIKQKK
ncbi:MAG TPA: divergent polysaccharide deacetylase family protein [Clostridiales bacterium]|nr:divergent polysaccharide deacetylase family protein [Clostridiales bacterium]HQP70705.1 divergent polysaccharide deacetylase family protein [Clostridiales bacterium]